MLTLTRLRQRILIAIDNEPDRYYLEASQVWDRRSGRKYTAEFRKYAAVGWIRVARDDERPKGALSTRTYYLLTAEGQRLKGGSN